MSEPTCAPTETEPAPEAGLESTPEPTFGPTAEPVAEESTGPALACAIRWVFGAGEGLPGWGEAITLQAEIDPVAEGARLQWQIAPKPADQLKENEEEWVDAPGECGLRYTFTLAEGMQAWRWRLRVIPAAGEPVYSDEVALPPVAVDEEDDLADGPGALPAEDVLGAQEATALPMANIRFTAGVPDEEITIGTEIVLLAEIENAREGMVLQWQYAVDGGAEPAWEDIAGANEAAYAYVLDEENAQWLWRLLITVPEPAEEEPGDEAISVAEESPADEGTQATEASGGLEAEAIAAETLPQ
ncbi:MAG: hypothetical protein LBU67_09750 [Oscillospiraceae bacterium]|nr:hypothetical protein [Oscillospiraceae bacterium]